MVKAFLLSPFRGGWHTWAGRGGLLAVLALLQACAAVPYPDRRDPIESFNRRVFDFNYAVDRAVIKPVATVYRDATPSWMRSGVGNFFNNLEDVWSVVNNALQGRLQNTGDSVGRVVINSTIGVAGLMDVASGLNIERHTTDFGTTLGRWGVSPGPYVVLPFLGSYTLREVAALPIDRQGDLVNHVSDEATRTALFLVDTVDVRAALLGPGEVAEAAALDKYSFKRETYFQMQRNRQYDGNPPDEDFAPEP